jgi:hypothetical protein
VWCAGFLRIWITASRKRRACNTTLKRGQITVMPAIHCLRLRLRCGFESITAKAIAIAHQAVEAAHGLSLRPFGTGQTFGLSLFRNQCGVLPVVRFHTVVANLLQRGWAETQWSRQPARRA